MIKVTRVTLFNQWATLFGTVRGPPGPGPGGVGAPACDTAASRPVPVSGWGGGVTHHLKIRTAQKIVNFPKHPKLHK